MIHAAPCITFEQESSLSPSSPAAPGHSYSRFGQFSAQRPSRTPYSHRCSSSSHAHLRCARDLSPIRTRIRLVTYTSSGKTNPNFQVDHHPVWPHSNPSSIRACIISRMTSSHITLTCKLIFHQPHTWSPKIIVAAWCTLLPSALTLQ